MTVQDTAGAPGLGNTDLYQRSCFPKKHVEQHNVKRGFSV